MSGIERNQKLFLEQNLLICHLGFVELFLKYMYQWYLCIIIIAMLSVSPLHRWGVGWSYNWKKLSFVGTFSVCVLYCFVFMLISIYIYKYIYIYILRTREFLFDSHCVTNPATALEMGATNERRHFFETPSLIGWGYSQNGPCNLWSNITYPCFLCSIKRPYVWKIIHVHIECDIRTF